MCWESNSRAIVMLTRTFEKGREKCDHYWPHDTVPVYYGDIKVTLLNDSHYPDWVITEFMMTRVCDGNFLIRQTCTELLRSRVTSNVSSAISTLQRGPISVCQILLKRSPASCALSANELDLINARSQCTAVLGSVVPVRSLHSTEYFNKFRYRTMSISSVLSGQCEKVSRSLNSNRMKHST